MALRLTEQELRKFIASSCENLSNDAHLDLGSLPHIPEYAVSMKELRRRLARLLDIVEDHYSTKG